MHFLSFFSFFITLVFGKRIEVLQLKENKIRSHARPRSQRANPHTEPNQVQLSANADALSFVQGKKQTRESQNFQVELQF
jgi:hypothetical protein